MPAAAAARWSVAPPTPMGGAPGRSAHGDAGRGTAAGGLVLGGRVDVAQRVEARVELGDRGILEQGHLVECVHA